MKIALAQMDALIGDFKGNTRKIIEFAGRALSSGAELCVFPELAVCGYPPMDLLDQASFMDCCAESLRVLQRDLPPEIACIVGYVDRNRSGTGKALINSAALIRGGRVDFIQGKTLLPGYDVFDEARYFEPAKERRVFELGGKKIGIAICEDIWWDESPVPGMRYPDDPIRDLLDSGARIIVSPSASPFHADKLAQRLRLVSRVAAMGHVPVVYCNMVGANDSIVFDGRSFAVDASGRLLAMAGWEEALLLVDTESSATVADIEPDRWEDIERALVEGIRSYMRKTGFTKAHLGLSGGIDSAIVAVLAARAVGPENLVCIGMPTRYSSRGSIDDSCALCANLGVKFRILPIEDPFSSFLGLLDPLLKDAPSGLCEENLQARIRGLVLMAWSNRYDSLLLATGNKSELATGYCTLYGDMCGALSPIGDLFKGEVYALSRHVNERGLTIPEAILTKAPSAELKPDQCDQDTLPPYEILDAILERHIVRNESLGTIVAAGYDGKLVRRIMTMVAKAEYKRRQAAPVIKVSSRAFGTGRRIPMARAIYEAGDA